jgi:hypothetical protein
MEEDSRMRIEKKVWKMEKRSKRLAAESGHPVEEA